VFNEKLIYGTNNLSLMGHKTQGEDLFFFYYTNSLQKVRFFKKLGGMRRNDLVPSIFQANKWLC
jgi:hypothetical protein